MPLARQPVLPARRKRPARTRSFVAADLRNASALRCCRDPTPRRSWNPSARWRYPRAGRSPSMTVGFALRPRQREWLDRSVDLGENVSLLLDMSAADRPNTYATTNLDVI